MSANPSEKSLRLVVVTPETTILDTEAEFVAFPAVDGQIGILPGRAPLVARLGPGELRFRVKAETKRFFIDGGFGQVRENTVTILTARALSAETLTLSALEKQLAEINAEIPTNDDKANDKARRLVRARAQLRVAHGSGKGSH